MGLMQRWVFFFSIVFLTACQPAAPTDEIVAVIPVASQTANPAVTPDTVNQLVCEEHMWFFDVPADLRIGCPLAAVGDTTIVSQSFEFGTIIHWPDRNLFYALLSDGTAFVYDSQLELEVIVPEEPPAGLHFPAGDIGNVWQSGRIYGQPVRDRLMWATAEAQEFSTKLQLGSGYICVTLADGTVVQLPSEVGAGQPWRVVDAAA